MSNQQNRVLNRMGARELTLEEIEHICGSAGTRPPVCTQACTFPPAFMAGQSSNCDSECPTP